MRKLHFFYLIINWLHILADSCRLYVRWLCVYDLGRSTGRGCAKMNWLLSPPADNPGHKPKLVLSVSNKYIRNCITLGSFRIHFISYDSYIHTYTCICHIYTYIHIHNITIYTYTIYIHTHMYICIL